ncbi:MAG: tyrosine-type recombinase/integrase [Terriglobales bacterium]
MPRTHADGVYTRKDRAGYWISWRDANGRRRIRKAEAPTLQQARAALAEEKRRLEQARVLGFQPPSETSFGDTADKFTAYQRARLTAAGSAREAGIVNKHLKPFFAGQLKAIRRADVQRYVAARAGKASAYSILHELTCIKHLLRLAVEWELLPINPAHGVRGPKPPAGRVRYLQPGELRAVVTVAPEWLRPIIALAVSTGMRRGEILGLRWLDLDLPGRRVVLPQTKNGEGRIVYLNDAGAASIACAYRTGARPMDLVFPVGRPEKLSMAFSRACRAAGIVNFRWHDLRHTSASWMRMKGADIHTVAQLLGHKDLRMAARYQHLSPAFLAEAVGTLDGVFGDALGALPAGPLALPDAAAGGIFRSPRSPRATGFLAARDGKA